MAKGLVTKQQTIAVKQKLVSVRGQIASLRARATQLDAQEFAAQAVPVQEDADMQSRTSAIERELAGMEKQLNMSENVVSPYAGQVLELKVDAGGTVAEGQPVLSIQPDVHHLELLAYLPSLQAKDIKNGMEAQISPSTIKREEFGFMKGKVLYVSDYPATSAAMMRDFQNETLVTSLTQSGPVTEIVVDLELDRNAPSGFRWSTSQVQPPVVISGGTICTVEMVTRQAKAGHARASLYQTETWASLRSNMAAAAQWAVPPGSNRRAEDCFGDGASAPPLFFRWKESNAARRRSPLCSPITVASSPWSG